MPKLIHDEFTILQGTVSRQRIWQLLRTRERRCIICGEPAVTRFRCLFHRQAALLISRKYAGCARGIRGVGAGRRLSSRFRLTARRKGDWVGKIQTITAMETTNPLSVVSAFEGRIPSTRGQEYDRETSSWPRLFP